MYILRWLLLSFMLALPSGVEAAVIINEIAWMGSSESANDEWIELYNTSEAAVLLDGWTLSDGMNLEIGLAGTVAPSAYAVLERTDDSSAAGSAFMIYTGALTNTGATLTLRRADGSIEDQVAGGSNWESIGGDNTTKETAQYTTSGWVTAVGTPGQENHMTETADAAVENDGTESSEEASDESASQEDRVVLESGTLDLTITGPKTVYVGQTTYFTAEPGGLGGAVSGSLRYRWNFGDLATRSGKEVEHVYQYPGSYVVSVYASYGEYTYEAMQTVTVLPIQLSITYSPQGDVQIHNDSKYVVDLSGFTIVGDKSRIIPPRTKLLAAASLTVPRSVLFNGSGVGVLLYDAAGSLVLAEATQDSHQESIAESPRIVSYAPPRATEEPVAAATDQTGSFAFSSELAATAYAAETSTVTDETQTALHQTQTDTKPNSWPFVGLIGVMLIGTVGLLVKGSAA